MAKASAKKAAAAQQSAASFYRPFLIGINLFYCFFLYYLNKHNTTTSILCSLFIFGLHYYAYLGILDHAANRKSDDTSLVGGAMLDLLAVLMVLQFGSLYSTRILWALGLIPVWGAYSLYKLVRGGGGDGGGAAPSSTGGDTREESEDTKAKRQKRAEKRRQKWS